MKVPTFSGCLRLQTETEELRFNLATNFCNIFSQQGYRNLKIKVNTPRPAITIEPSLIVIRSSNSFIS